MTAPTRFPAGLYGITPQWDDTNQLMQGIEAAIRGGMTALQWRQKNLDADTSLRLANAAAELCRRHGVLFIVNDSIELAQAVQADGIHLGRDDPLPAQARRQLGPNVLIGCSCYNELDRARQALQEGADYIAFGAVYPSQVKPQAVRAHLDILSQAKTLARANAHENRAAIVAIGGITLSNAPAVIQAGADSLAVISGLFQTPDIQTAAKAFSALFTTRPSGPDEPPAA